MGKSTSSPLADIFMEDFEQKALATFPHRDSVLFWFRKADDTLTAIHTDHIDALFTHLNSLHPDIKWTKEVEVNNNIHMLDVDISKNSNSSLSFDVYRKPTHTNQYIHFNSHAPLQQYAHSPVEPKSFHLPTNSENRKKNASVTLFHSMATLIGPSGKAHTSPKSLSLHLLLSLHPPATAKLPVMTLPAAATTPTAAAATTAKPASKVA